MYEDQTYENILDRSLARVASDVDKREGSVIMNCYSPCIRRARRCIYPAR